MISSTLSGLSLRRKRNQIALSSCAILIQYLALIALSAQAVESNKLLITTIIGCLAATIMSVLLIEGLRRYPGVESTSYIIPAFAISYGLLLIVFILGRLEYSRILLASSFCINLAMFVTLHLIFSKTTVLRIGVITEGNFSDLITGTGAEWSLLSSPNDSVDGLDAVAVDLRSNLSDDWERRLAEYALRGLPVLHSKHLLESLTGKVELEYLSENSFGTLSPLHAYMNIKQLTDFAIAAILLILLSPLLLLISISIKVDSSGPVIFRQIRIGYQGKPFRVFKFRTMTAADRPQQIDLLEAAKTKADDLRVTRIGGFLRRTRLDELPQMLNILKGEMSWIGPRPEAAVLSQWYEDEIPFYRYRHIVRPGITGWAQVNQGHVADVDDVTRKLHYDFYYIKHFSPWIDLLIAARTIPTMISGFGAR